MDLQGRLVEVMESERAVLAAENGRLAAEAGWLRRKAGELGRCVVRMREEQRGMWALGRRVEGLQRQVAGLERRNREWCEVMIMMRKEGEGEGEVERLREENRRLREAAVRGRRNGWCTWGKRRAKKSGGGKGVGRMGCFLWEPCFCNLY